MTDTAPTHQNRLLKALQGPRLGMVVLIGALLFLVFTVIYAINVAQSRHTEQTLAALVVDTAAKKDVVDKRRFEIIVRNQEEMIRQLQQRK